MLIISGPSTTGKSTLAHRLSKDLKIPTFQRDEYKVSRFDELGGVPSLKQYARIDAESKQELLARIQNAIKSDQDLIIESNFMFSARGKLEKYIQEDTNVIEIFCWADGRTILKRYTRRWKSGERHRGHRDNLWRPIVAIESLGFVHLRYKPLQLSSHTQTIDTSDFSKLDYPSVYRYIQEKLQ